MKTLRWRDVWAASCLAVVTAQAAEPAFSESVTPADFAGAGLDKLSAQERARLDGLVRDYKSGALAAARRAAALAEEARARAEANAARAQAEAQKAKAESGARVRAPSKAADDAGGKSERGLLTRAKVLLAPGTKIEYSTVDSRIVGEFSGWQPRTVFTLDNGQRWQALSRDSYVASPVRGPGVKIVPGLLGTFWMHIEGVRPRVKVSLLSSEP